ncbi:MAG: FKBP-type peptidyl-prolyl cis-trans isomerase [Bacteroidales bacterium]|nr:FKBP-type peptidyl-prolyl cis-trans isomerase [Bacteroidales bacterium]
MDFLIKIANSFFIIGTFFFFISCTQSTPVAVSNNNFKTMDDTVIKFNRQVVKTEADEIEDFIQRYHWKMNTSETGLRYMIYKNGNGEKAKKGKTVVLNYTLKLINGEVVYSTDGEKKFETEIGKSHLTNGLEEGVLLMRTGDKAKFILPSHLAFGLLGDQNKIPQRAILIYDVELCEVK